MIFPRHCKFLDIFSKLISNTIYKCIPFIIFIFALPATTKMMFFQDTTSCSRWWWFNFRSSHTSNKFLLWQFTFDLNVSRLRQSIERAVATNVKATFSVNRTLNFKITVFDSKAFPCFQSFRTFQKWFFIKQSDMLFAFISSVMKWTTAYQNLINLTLKWPKMSFWWKMILKVWK